MPLFTGIPSLTAEELALVAAGFIKMAEDAKIIDSTCTEVAGTEGPSVPAMKPLSPDYVPNKDWSPGIPYHRVDEETGKPTGTDRPKV